MSRLAIVGSREFSNQSLAEESFKQYCCSCQEYGVSGDPLYHGGYYSQFDEIVSGGATGADSIGAAIAKKWKIKLTEYLPDWKTYGKRAGFVRNEDIIKNADVVLAFWNGVSKGTANSLSIAKRLKKPTIIIYF